MAFRSAGGCTRCPGATPQRGPVPVLSPGGLRRSWSVTPSGPACADLHALAGHGGLALVAGEPGVGKSRLVAEIGDEAQAGGMRVLTGHCVEMSGAPPYLPYVEIIEQAISNPRSPLALREALGDVAPEIARIVPALRRVFPDIPPPVEVPAELARRYVEQLQRVRGRAAQDQPLLVVLEDLHWADESTVLLTEYLAPLLPEMPVLVLGTYRDVEVDLSHPLARVISQLGRQRLLERVSLRRLSFDGVRAMLRALAGQPAPEELIRVITARPTATRSSWRRSICTLSSRECCSTSMAGCVVTCGWMRCRCRRASAWCWVSGWTAWPPLRMRCW